jgi:hypothetical protein
MGYMRKEAVTALANIKNGVATAQAIRTLTAYVEFHTPKPEVEEMVFPCKVRLLKPFTNPCYGRDNMTVGKVYTAIEAAGCCITTTTNTEHTFTCHPSYFEVVPN